MSDDLSKQIKNLQHSLINETNSIRNVYSNNQFSDHLLIHISMIDRFTFLQMYLTFFLNLDDDERTHANKRISQDNDEQHFSSKRLCLEETNIINNDQATVSSSLPVDTILMHPPLDLQDSNDIEITKEPKQTEEILENVRADNPNDDRWEPYNGCDWSNESRAIKFEIMVKANNVFRDGKISF